MCIYSMAEVTDNHYEGKGPPLMKFQPKVSDDHLMIAVLNVYNTDERISESSEEGTLHGSAYHNYRYYDRESSYIATSLSR